MLATTRPGITRALGELTAAGAIDHGLGKITILDRAVVESLSCECYEIGAGLYSALYQDGAR